MLAPLLAVTLTCLAQTDPPPTISRPSPDIVKCGSPCTITVRSTNAKQRFDSSCRVVFADPGGATAKIQQNHGDRLTITITVPADPQLTTRDLRIASDFGISNTVQLFVTDRAVHAEHEPNNTPAQANALTLDTVVTGTIHAGTEQDRWRFSADQGQDVKFQLTTKGLPSKLDPAMTVIAPNGTVIAWSQTTRGGHTYLAFRSASKTTYQLLVHDVQFRGGSDYRYHLRASAPTPQASIPFPAPGSTAEAEPNQEIQGLNPHAVPFAVSAHIAEAADVDLFCFEVKTAQALALTADGSPYGSAIDPLLELMDASGKRIKIDDDSGAGNAARIVHNFGPGRYVAGVRNLTGDGDAPHRYLLSVAQPTRPGPDFEVRFRPDSVRVGLGSHAKIWCEVIRHGGFKGHVDLRIPNPPAGISMHPVRLGPGNNWTSVFTVQASEEAALGTQRLHLTAAAKLGDLATEHTITPEAGSITSSSAWVTVLKAPPFLAAPYGPTSAQTRDRWKQRRTKLTRRLSEASPKLQTELKEFRQDHAAGLHWIALTPTKMVSRREVKFTALEDGSVLAKGSTPANDTYDIEFDCPIEEISAIRLDALPHPSLAAGGPGRHPTNGNFVLNRFLVEAAPLRQRDAMTKVSLRNASARLEQKDYGVKFAIDNKIKTGWAMHPYTGQANWLIADLQTPIKNAGGTCFRITLDQLHGSQHVLGRFQVSVARRRLPAKSLVVPPSVHATLASDQDNGQVAKWFQTVSPSLAAIRTRIEEIDAGQGNRRAIERAKRQLRIETTEIVAARHKWEQGAGKTAKLPAKLSKALSIPADQRDTEQRRLIAAQFRRIAPQLAPVRARIDLLRAEQVEYPPRIQRGKTGNLVIRVTRTQDHPSPITVTLEGYSSGRGKNRAPRPITASLAVQPVTLEPGQSVAVIKLRATKKAELGNRAVVVRASGLQDGKPVVTYSAPILVEVTK